MRSGRGLGPVLALTREGALGWDGSSVVGCSSSLGQLLHSLDLSFLIHPVRVEPESLEKLWCGPTSLSFQEDRAGGLYCNRASGLPGPPPARGWGGGCGLANTQGGFCPREASKAGAPGSAEPEQEKPPRRMLCDVGC